MEKQNRVSIPYRQARNLLGMLKEQLQRKRFQFLIGRLATNIWQCLHFIIGYGFNSLQVGSQPCQMHCYFLLFLVSIPYRQARNVGNLPIYMKTLVSFNSLQVGSQQKIHPNQQLQEFLVSIPYRQARNPYLKAKDMQYVVEFQFLIGRLATHSSMLYPKFYLKVSIPYRQARNNFMTISG